MEARVNTENVESKRAKKRKSESEEKKGEGEGMIVMSETHLADGLLFIVPCYSGSRGQSDREKHWNIKIVQKKGWKKNSTRTTLNPHVKVHSIAVQGHQDKKITEQSYWAVIC